MATKKYRITTPFYRDGLTYPAGSVVEFPSDEKVNPDWEVVKKAEEVTDPATPMNDDKLHAPKINSKTK